MLFKFGQNYLFWFNFLQTGKGITEGNVKNKMNRVKVQNDLKESVAWSTNNKMMIM